jgi:hypothetical protein
MDVSTQLGIHFSHGLEVKDDYACSLANDRLLGGSKSAFTWSHRVTRDPMTNTSTSFALIHEVDPLRDARWQDLLQRHPAASVFHSVGWLKAIQLTYGYEPIAFTTSQPAKELESGLLFCRVRSWMTGNRMVSVPFSDHCEPLCESEEQLADLLAALQNNGLRKTWKYFELRPVCQSLSSRLLKLGFQPTAHYILHSVNLDASDAKIFARFHRNCIQRRVRHAERVGVTEVCGRSQTLLRDFYGLMIRTRARHGMPPQPHLWFENVLESLGDAADLRLAYIKDTPIAAVLVLHFKGTSYFKYGCSDERFHSLGAMPLLLWRAILKAKSVGSKVFDLGRTDCDDLGLIVFKDHWTRVSNPLTYVAWPPRRVFSLASTKKTGLARRVCSFLPQRLLRIAGTVLYRHIG